MIPFSFSRQVRVQDFDPGFQLCIPGESHYTGVDFTTDRCLWSSQWRPLLLPWHHPGLSVLRVAASVLPQWLCIEAIRLGMVALASLADLDHPAYLDAEVRASRRHGETFRGADVRLAVDWPVNGTQQAKGRPAGSEGGGTYAWF